MNFRDRHLESQAATAEAALNQLAVAIILLNQQRNVVFMNQAAET
ncbi:MAG: hypothetical protein QOF90_1189, partial [Acetobacteraceae bacterium]|nr:hypothetical protein [Acetobacteraceae bacterium]